jgi:phosphoglycolate phosphatase-like HAD superfamily hydrolase
MKRLILFDIDGTLVLDDGAAREAYSIGLEQVFGHSGSIRQYDFSGKTDPEITHMVLGDAGWSREAVDERLDALWDVYTRELAARATAERIRALPGIFPLLEELSRDRTLQLALLTGNIERGARIKLAPHGLNDYFAFGAFGSDHHQRDMLPPIAIRRALEATGIEFSPRDVVIIGDSIYDIRCGVPHGATTIAVPTGRTPAALLQAENPHHLFPSLEPAAPLLDAIRGR